MTHRIYIVTVEYPGDRVKQFEQKVPVFRMPRSPVAMNNKVARIIERKLAGTNYNAFEFKLKPDKDNPAVTSSRQRVTMKVGMKAPKPIDIEKEERKRNAAVLKKQLERRAYEQEQKRMRELERERSQSNESKFTTADLIPSDQ